MINWIHSKLNAVESGWDPITAKYASEYALNEWEKLDESVLDPIEEWVGGFGGKEVLDLGGGPGQFSVAMARRGANVTWHDVSRNYQRILDQRAQGLPIRISLGYMEDAVRLGTSRFDVIFSRICWYYCRGDRSFSRLIYNLLRPGGIGYVDTNNSTFQYASLSNLAKFRTWLNSATFLKIGHPHPPRGRIASLMMAFPLKRIAIDYSRETNDRILFEKSEAIR